MKTLVEHIAQSLVDDPESVKVEEHQEGQTVYLRLTVQPDDMGNVIGKNGRTAKALRPVVYAAVNKQGKKVKLDIVE